jgi:KipI family sensor histidine kinase inhibitor
MRTRSLGPQACLFEVGNPRRAASLASWLRARCPGIVDIVPAATTVLCDGVTDWQDLHVAVSSWGASDVHVQIPGILEIPVCYDGPDLRAIAQMWGMSPAEAVIRHQELEFVGVFCGFSPGFTYLAGLPAEFRVARLDTPRARVPPGSVAIADEWCAVYPSPTPGGWRILGTTPLRLWDQGRAEPALIAPGQRVRFVAET